MNEPLLSMTIPPTTNVYVTSSDALEVLNNGFSNPTVQQGLADFLLGTTPLDGINKIYYLPKAFEGSGSYEINDNKFYSGYYTLYSNNRNIVKRLRDRYLRITRAFSTIYSTKGNYLDFEPYTNFTLYVPFVGAIPIPTRKLYGNILRVHYTIDLCTAMGSCMVLVTKDDGTDKEILSTTAFELGSDIPFSIFGGDLMRQGIAKNLGGILNIIPNLQVLTDGIMKGDNATTSKSSMGSSNFMGIQEITLIKATKKERSTNNTHALPNGNYGAIGSSGFWKMHDVKFNTINTSITELELSMLTSAIETGVYFNDND